MPRKTIHNNITNPDLIARIHPENRELLNSFLHYLHSIRRSESTIKGYESDILIALVWNLNNNNNKSYIKWTKRNVVDLQNWMINENMNSPARVRRLKAALSSMSNYIVNVLDDEYPDFRNIINMIENPVNTPVREKTVLSEENVEYLLTYLVEKGRYEQACAVALAAYSGRRKSELPRLKVSDFEDDKLVCNGAMYKSAPIKTKGRGGGKFIPCYTLAKKFKPYLDMWMEQRRKDGIESEWLLPNPEGGMLATTTLNHWALGFSRIMEMDFYWHCMRHAYTTYLVRAGLPDNVITQIVGWESSDMCKVYTDIEVDEQIGLWFEDGDIVSKKQTTLNDIQ